MATDGVGGPGTGTTTAAAAKQRKFTIKPFRTHQPMDDASARQIWSQLERAIDEIHNRNASQLSFEELYRNAYNLVLHKHGALLYDGVTEKIGSHLSNTANGIATASDAELLDCLSRKWTDHSMILVMVRDILMYMDRTYVLQHKLRPVYELGLCLFRDVVWEHPNVQPRVTNLILSCIEQERKGQIVDASLLKVVLGMLLELGGSMPPSAVAGGAYGESRRMRAHTNPSSFTAAGNVYERDFEQIFLGTTQEFYHLESLDYLSRNTASDYATKAQSRLEEELDRAKRYLGPTTEAPLMGIVETELIERHAKTLVDMEHSGYASLLSDSESKMEDLLQMYDLFARVPNTVEFLRDALGKAIKADGRALVRAQETGAAEPTSFVRGVLTMRQKYASVVDYAFRREKRAQKKLKESFEDFLNQDSRAASCLALYVDELLRTGLRGCDESRVDEELLKVILVFRYLQDKDVFESFYKQHLAKRLLSGRSVSEEAERAMVSQLKAECGYQFTSKLEGMFNDMRISRDTRDAYRRFEKTQSDCAEVEMEVDVLTTGYWPSQNVPPCTLPKEVQSAINRFSNFYLQKHTGRKLSWQTSTGSGEVRATFGGEGSKVRKHDLCVTTYQMCILVLFNEKATQTLSEIRERTQIPDAELRRHLISLCTPKHRILRKASRGKVITEGDSFAFNRDFTSKLKRVKIPLVSMKETIGGDGRNAAAGGANVAAASGGTASSSAGENTASGNVTGGMAVPAAVEEDRRHLVEAVVMRIMKARKTLHHNDLIAEVSKQLSVRFVPSPTFVKKRIESLIERDYLERSEDDRRVYVYLA